MTSDERQREWVQVAAIVTAISAVGAWMALVRIARVAERAYPEPAEIRAEDVR